MLKKHKSIGALAVCYTEYAVPLREHRFVVGTVGEVLLDLVKFFEYQKC